MNSIKIDPNLQESLDLSHPVRSAMADSTLDSPVLNSVIQGILENASFTCASALSPGFPNLGETVEIVRPEPAEIDLEAIELELVDVEEPFDFPTQTVDENHGIQEDLADFTFLSHRFTEASLDSLASFRKTLEKARTQDSFHPEALALLEMIALEIELAKLGTTIKPFDFLIRSLLDRPITDEDLSDLQFLLANFAEKRLQRTEFYP